MGALDLSRLAPSLQLKLVAEPNVLLNSDQMREDHAERINGTIVAAYDALERNSKMWALELVD